MNIELESTLLLLVLCWVILTVLDVAVAGLLCLLGGVTFKKAFAWGLLSLLLPPLLFAYGITIERNWYQVKEVALHSATLPQNFEGYRMVHISDLHLRSFQGREKSLQRLVDKINSLDADMICFTGDLVTMSPDEIDGFETMLATLSARDGIYSVMGNHDYMMYAGHKESTRDTAALIRELQEAQLGMGWHLLLDENAIIRRGADSIAVVGVQNISTSKHFPSKGNLAKALSGTENCYKILLSHDPTHWEKEVTDMNIALTLSGHTHATQFSIFGWCPAKYVYRQYRGLYEHNGQQLYVNSGIGETIFPARIGVRPEVTLITLSRL